jgi:hypothetical protein
MQPFEPFASIKDGEIFIRDVPIVKNFVLELLS